MMNQLHRKGMEMGMTIRTGDGELESLVCLC